MPRGPGGDGRAHSARQLHSDGKHFADNRGTPKQPWYTNIDLEFAHKKTKQVTKFYNSRRLCKNSPVVNAELESSATDDGGGSRRPCRGGSMNTIIFWVFMHLSKAVLAKI